ncbi:MAG: FAD-dependent oxidoreductase [Legionella sp.]|nr:FAD-dependent oxidoreductase [Legionella sp.]
MQDTITKLFQWAVVGAGPSGIAAVGKLLDNKISPNDILWVDPNFKVGDFGLLWSSVSSNTKVRTFIDFLEAIHFFAFNKVAHQFNLMHLNPDDTCILSDMVAPLQWVTDKLMKAVVTKHTRIDTISLSKQTWSLCSKKDLFKAKNIILSTGAVPNRLHYPNVETIPFEDAIDKSKLAKVIDLNETCAVFGSSHSAIIIIRHLVELGIKKVVNIYRSPCRYAIDMGTWTLFDNTGLKGHTAEWAREHIDGTLPNNLVRYKTNDEDVLGYLADCDKVIYAVGFEKRNSVVIDGFEEICHNPHTGILAPGLFGFGIAYPELKTDPVGNVESQVGLWKFMVYLNKAMPLWFKYTT